LKYFFYLLWKTSNYNMATATPTASALAAAIVAANYSPPTNDEPVPLAPGVPPPAPQVEDIDDELEEELEWDNRFECPGCETGIDADGPHRKSDGEYYLGCCCRP
jgi:hypothetical protein